VGSVLLEPAYLALACIIAFTASYVATSKWINIARLIGLEGRDMNKGDRRLVAEAGGVWPLLGAVFGLLALESLYIYLEGDPYRFIDVMSLSLLLLLSAFLGFMDDLLGWKKGLRVWQRVVFMAPIAAPLVAVKAGVSVVSLPLVGAVDLGLLYPLVLIPVGVLGASNAFNMVGGYNGLEAGMAATIMAFTAAYSIVKGLDLALQASLIMLSSVAAFLVFNWYPARVFPGNAFTYGFGAYYAGVVVLDDFQRFGLALFSLYFLELALFIRGLLNGVYKENFARVTSRGLEPPYEKAYSVTHIALKLQIILRGRATERGVTATLLAVQAAIGLASLAVYT
jgi:UDP-N-acetylglucosamine--dolichyl-phosphate N-acetylglucosaminephosphotransferase